MRCFEQWHILNSQKDITYTYYKLLPDRQQQNWF